MTTPSEEVKLPELPELPEPFMLSPVLYEDWANQMRAYALQAVLEERERCANIVSGFIERNDKAWLSDIAAAIRTQVTKGKE